MTIKNEASDFKHDVAFSFRSPDLKLANQLADALKPMTSFVYVREQDELAGTDGMETVRSAFRQGSRLNVILLRDDWGETPWTRIEEAAIKDRCFEEGWDNLFVIALNGATQRKWIPKSIISLDFNAYGIEQAIGAIKRQVQQLGGVVKPPTTADVARAKLARAEFDRETETLFSTDEGVRLADEATTRVTARLLDQLQIISTEGKRKWTVLGGWHNAGYGVVRAQGCSALFNWDRYANSCKDCELRVGVYAAAFETPEDQKAGRRFDRWGNNKPASEAEYKIWREPSVGFVWLRHGKIWTPEDVADQTLLEMVGVLTAKR